MTDGKSPRRRSPRIKRRELILVLGGVVTARTLYAQQKAMPVIGFLGLSPDPVNFVTVMYARPAARAGTRLARHSAAVGQGLAPCLAPPHGR
jgi:hypothetical protein